MRDSGESARILFSSSEEYYPAAARELTDAHPGTVAERLGPDLGCLTGEGLSVPGVARRVRSEPLVFVRHLAEETDRLPVDGTTPRLVAETALARLRERGVTGPELAVQSWVSGRSPLPFGSRELFEAVAELLAEAGITAVRAGTETVLAVSVHAKGVSLGLAEAADTITDWPGGRVRMARTEGMVSRAEFKLEELFKTVGHLFPHGGTALDLGASPGGWTRILRGRGMEVWAVDPGDLDARLAGDPLIHHERTTAGRFLASSNRRFDLVVNDMKMEPELSCRVMLDTARSLHPGTLAVVTLKVGVRSPVGTVRHGLDLLRKRYEIVEARKLHHNRNEITVVARTR